MTIRLLFFAMLRDKMGKSEDELILVPGETVAMLARRVLGAVPSHALLFAANQCYVAADYLLKDGDEIAFIPPVAGG